MRASSPRWGGEPPPLCEPTAIASPAVGDTVGGFRNSLDMSTGMARTKLGRPVHESSDMMG